MKTVDALLAGARAAGLDRLDAQILLAHVLRRDRSWLHAHGDEVPTAADAASIERLVERRAAGEPIAYLVGEKEFHGLMLRVSPAVLVPRPDTETLVDWALQVLEGVASPSVLDMGTGSGAIALALKHRRPDCDATAVDASLEALAVAHDNAQRLSLPLTLLHGDWWQALPDRSPFDLIVSNPPYIAAGDLHLPALRHEPELALTTGGHGTEALAELARGAPDRLRAGGWLLMEHGYDQANEVRHLLDERGFHAVETRQDLAGRDRCTGGRWG